jgi:2-polyprenyl-3-methyl-5-hydroxy-6-metoxy-1,4-benzoquinol methylase
VNSGYFENPRTDMVPFVPIRRERALEIGCGTGNFISSLTGCRETWGIEPSEAAQLAESRLTRVLNGPFDLVKHQLPKRHFDLVICNDVIEHMADHRAFFSEIGEYITPGGMLIGSIPNVRFYANLFQLLLEKDWRYEDSGILDRTHLAFFTAKSLRQTIEAADLNVVSLTGINYDHLPDNRARTRCYLLLAKVLGKLTLGYFSDIRYLQIAFQATPRHRDVATPFRGISQTQATGTAEG